MPDYQSKVTHCGDNKQAPCSTAPTASPVFRVWAVIPAYNRPELLARAVVSLHDQGPELAGVIIVNNSNEAGTVKSVGPASFSVQVLNPGGNLGTAGGIAAGMVKALEDAGTTHVWVLDDDALATPQALAAMLAEAKRSGADAAAPLITDRENRVRWFPCPLPEPAWSAIRQNPEPAVFLGKIDGSFLPWSWAIWASLLLSRRAIETVGLPRADLWSQFSDVEYTLRVSRRFKCVLAPRSVCQHWPEENVSDAVVRPKLLSALQNGSYVSLHLRHGWRWLRHLPGLYFRYLRHFHWKPWAWWDCVKAMVVGGVFGRPAGRR